MSYPLPYGNAPRHQSPWRPQVNLYGDPIVQPQPNPYVAHYPQHLGQTGSTGMSGFTTLLMAAAVVGVGWYLLAGPAAPPTQPKKSTGKKGWWVVYKGELDGPLTAGAADAQYRKYKNDPDPMMRSEGTFYGTAAEARERYDTAW